MMKFLKIYILRFLNLEKKNMASTDVADLLFRFQQIQADDHDILINRFCELIQESISVDLNLKVTRESWIFENRLKRARIKTAHSSISSHSTGIYKQLSMPGSNMAELFPFHVLNSLMTSLSAKDSQFRRRMSSPKHGQFVSNCCRKFYIFF